MKGACVDTRQKTILLAEDECSVREGLVALFESEGYAVRATADGVQAVEAFLARRPDLVLLDVMMPGKNGFTVCREILARDSSVPVLFLTAKDSEADELRGLMLGATDYISKTASQAVLLARVANALARAVRTHPAQTGGFPFAGQHVDTAQNRLVSPAGTMVDLTLREVELLRCFAAHPNELLSRDFLLTRFWGLDYEGNESAVSVAISRLRDKLGPSGSRIETVYGNGYRFCPES